jgi:hypothetical protein
MKKAFLASLLYLVPLFLFAQKKAVTETGEEVILYTDGTWKYADSSSLKETEIATNPNPFKKKISSTFLLKSTNVNVGVWLDPKKWSFKKGGTSDAAEYELGLKGKDLYGLLITEKVEFPLETFKTVAIENARDASPDIKIVKQEYRTVNGKKILMLQMDGSMQGVKFSYYGYYYSNEKGSVQFVTYTAQNLLKDYLNDVEELLNGLVTIE